MILGTFVTARILAFLPFFTESLLGIRWGAFTAATVLTGERNFLLC